jgi:LCP family protein required for cell wall assembly
MPIRRRTGRAVRVAILAVVGLAVLSAAFVAWEVRRWAAIPRVEVAAVQAPADGEVSNWLLVGTDGRDGIDPSDPNAGAFLGEEVVGTRTDTILVARADAGAGTVDLLSIPRDLWVPIAERGETGRINGAYNGEGGPQRLAATVEASLGIELHHYVEIDFTGFRDVVDALGGVTVRFDHPTRDQRSGLVVETAGDHHLDGDQALALARSRTYEQLIDGSWQVDPTGDLGRTERQRKLLGQIVDAAGSSVGPTGVVTLDRVLAAGSGSVVLDDRTDLRAVVSLLRTAGAVGADGIASHALPVADHRTSGGAQVLVLRPAEAAEVLDRFRSPGP